MSFVCGFPGCDKAFTRSDNLKRHALVHTAERHQCPVEGCGQGFTTSHKLKAHVARHARPFPCTHCPEAFPSDEKRISHEAARHGALPHVCGVCNRAFRYPSELRAHASSHSAPQARGTHYCAVGECRQLFPSKEELVAHVRTEHPRPYTCTECGEGFTTSSNLSAHKKTHQASREMFKCTVDGCGREFTRRSNLNTHVQAAHLGEKPFACSYPGCGMRSAYRSKVEEHEAVLHRGQPRVKAPRRDAAGEGSIKERLGKRLRGS